MGQRTRNMGQGTERDRTRQRQDRTGQDRARGQDRSGHDGTRQGTGNRTEDRGEEGPCQLMYLCKAKNNITLWFHNFIICVYCIIL